MIEFEEHVPQKKQLDLTPMIDVVFLLLIFFLLTSVSSKLTMPLNLPEAETAAVSKEAPVVVSIKLDGSVYINGRQTTMEALPAEVESLYGGSADKELNLMSDKGVPFGTVVEVLDIAQKAGAQNIAVVTEQKIK